MISTEPKRIEEQSKSVFGASMIVPVAVAPASIPWCRENDRGDHADNALCCCCQSHKDEPGNACYRGCTGALCPCCMAGQTEWLLTKYNTDDQGEVGYGGNPGGKLCRWNGTCTNYCLGTMAVGGLAGGLAAAGAAGAQLANMLQGLVPCCVLGEQQSKLVRLHRGETGATVAGAGDHPYRFNDWIHAYLCSCCMVIKLHRDAIALRHPYRTGFWG